MSNASINIDIQVFVSTYVFISLIAVELLGHVVSLCLTF